MRRVSGLSGFSRNFLAAGGRRRTTLASSRYETAILEGKVGGRWYERATDGTECEWGSVLAWDPPAKVVLSWHLQPDWGYDPIRRRRARWRCGSLPQSVLPTLVELEHRNLERHGDGGAKLRDSVDGGWGPIVEQYGKFANEHAIPTEEL